MDSGQMEAKAIDNASIIDFGRRTLKLNLPSVSTLDEAQSIPDHEMRRRARLRDFIQNIKLITHPIYGSGQHAQQLARTIGDLVRIKKAQTLLFLKSYAVEEDKLKSAA